ncbi:unnamed protein product [Rotaria magnacalcarata]|uniref:N-acetyltransferase domain-containing protein n=1 Tax=Rotaria magnacalcarata TaxID=392030 RepID=A0A816R2J8_9BILA|nr:unnamed protein product [Rotaria magnacalcarata]
MTLTVSTNRHKNMTERFLLRRALDTDDVALSQLSQQTFLETYVEDFSIPYRKHDIEAYFRSSKSPEWFAGKIVDPLQATWVVEDKISDELVAFAIAGPCKLSHPDVCLGEDGDLQFLYVRRDRRSHGLGQQLMNTALLWLKERFKGRPIWLGVWSGNLKAQKFYMHYDFSQAGDYYFNTSNKVICIFTLTILFVAAFDPPVDNVVKALRSICNEKFLDDQCPYAIAYDLATHLTSHWYDQDGGYVEGRGNYISIYILLCNDTNIVSATDKLYLTTQWAAIETAKRRNNYVHTDYIDDQAWLANGPLRLEQYIRSTGDVTEELLQATQAVINNNIMYETEECDGGSRPPLRIAKTTISNVLTVFTMATMFLFTNDTTLLHGGIHGDQKDTLDTAHNNCTLIGGIISCWSLTYEYGVLVQAFIALENATGNQQYIADAIVFIHTIKMFTRNNIIYENCDDTNTCLGDQLAFRGVFYQGLGRLYERTKDDIIANVIESSYLAMVAHKIGNHYPLSLINDNNNFTGDDEIIVTIGDLNLVSAMIKVYKNKYVTFESQHSIDFAIHGLLPFHSTEEDLTGCVCVDYGCPRGLQAQCFNNSGHKEPTTQNNWKNKVSTILVAPEHQMKLFKSKGASSTDWLQNSLWYVGDDFNKNVDSIDIDY